VAETGRREGVAAKKAAPLLCHSSLPSPSPRPAATVIVVRDGPHPTSPLEVLLLRRSLQADFVGGAYVFPGGSVDAADRGARAQRLCPGRSDAAASATLGVRSGGLAYWVAAIRECFEEAGLLLARRDGMAVSFTDPGTAERFVRLRGALHAGECSFVDVCEAEGLTLCVESLYYFAHWITPERSTRRYDTRFFVAAAPEGQAPAHDAHETISCTWIRPTAALARHRAGQMELVLPTITSLQAIARFANTASLLAAVASLRDVPTILPKMVGAGANARLLLPGDPGYEELDGAGAAAPEETPTQADG
jgi:8-oxo-dGTP pyrophosphatase MutT (NUDIX family)